ncbi:nitrate- and nitrite sensing domain-containing protein [Marinospirillum alkaliphilum]|uniref:Stage II sporulation protein E (SpoIIE) n=1 Tax=Marinospirillum alkaliphilum DSM 21637 TaxID=1122209 RepID=A0A1K1ZMY1_9GAMM|nr:nitrate- and nitrite sensing domain-containing protein [Marinospirillum alkaliphilum]SFX75447.1 Stage II sporulation protein E (SpoIIE) [Marinospirillum alkaliphilum DSM 21637]
MPTAADHSNKDPSWLTTRLLVLIIAPVLLLGGIIISVAIDRFAQISQLQLHRESIRNLQLLSELVDALAMERGATNLILVSSGHHHMSSMTSIRQQTDRLSAQFLQLANRPHTPTDGTHFQRLSAALQALPEQRSEVDQLHVTPETCHQYYTSMISDLLLMADATGKLNNLHYNNQVKILLLISEAKERLGQTRALMTPILARNTVSSADEQQLIQLRTEFHLLINHAFKYSDQPTRLALDQFMTQDSLQRMLQIIQHSLAASAATTNLQPITYEQWFHLSSQAINQLLDTELRVINNLINENTQQLQSTQTTTASLVSFFMLFLLIILLVSAETHKSIKDKRELLLQLLNEKAADSVLAKQVYDAITRSSQQIRPQGINYAIQPCVGHEFSGDFVMLSRTPKSGVYHLLILDATGHGLSAAISLLPLIQIFRSMSEKGFELTDIICEANQKLEQILPGDRLVAAAFISLDLNLQQAQLWNAAMPDTLLLDRKNQARLLASDFLPLGATPLSKEEVKPNTISLTDHSIILLSDGLIEHTRGQKKSRAYKLLAENLILQHYQPDKVISQLLASGPPQDDMTLLIISHPDLQQITI